MRHLLVLLPPTNEVWDKVIFLHLSVILFTGMGVCSQGGLVPGGSALEGSASWGGAWSRGRGGGSAPGGCLVDPPPPRTATAADGTHPTGIHSCF